MWVCDSLFFFLFSVIIICNSVYIFTFNCYVMYSSTFGKGWVGRSCLYLLVWVSFGSFSLRELTCMHCVYLVRWTRKVLCGSFLCAIYKFSFIHSFMILKFKHWVHALHIETYQSKIVKRKLDCGIENWVKKKRCKICIKHVFTVTQKSLLMTSWNQQFCYCYCVKLGWWKQKLR